MINNKVYVLLMLLMLLPSLSAINVEVQKLSSNEVLVPDIGPVVIDLEITNMGAPSYFEFYNLLGFEMYPVGTFYIGQGESKNIELRLSPIGNFTIRGPYNFEYYIRSQDGSEQKERLIFRVSDLEDSFEIGASEIDPESNSMQIYIKNKINFDFKEVKVKFVSAFFEREEELTLGPYGTKNFTIELNQNDFNSLMAGFYTLNADIDVDGKTTSAEGIIKFVEKDILIDKSTKYGFIINTQVIKKTNEGNVVTPSETIIQKNIFSRLFTSFSPEPDNVEREGFRVLYYWANQISPGETFKIKVKTNWFIPLIIILLVVAIVVAVKKLTTKTVALRKKVSFVRAKGADFGLKVSLYLNARQYVENVNVVDRLPPLVKLYEKFGIEKPKRVNEKNRTLEWSFEKLESGETRILSYIIYSKVGIMGRFALPPATAFYEKNGKINESSSNKAFFVTEQSAKDSD